MSSEPIRPFGDRESANTTNQNSDTVLRDMKDWGSDMASQAKDKAGQIADSVSETLDQQRGNAAATLVQVASTVHQKANSVPGGTKAVNLAHSVADGLESTGSYLRDHDFRQMGKDATNICRRYPAQSVIAAVALGFLVGRTARRK